MYFRCVRLFRKYTCVSIILLTCVGMYLLQTCSYWNDKELINSQEEDTASYHLILEYTKFFSKEKYCNLRPNENTMVKYGKLFKDVPTSAGTFTKLDRCKYKNCLFTCDKSQQNRAHALLFHDYDLLGDWMFSPLRYYNLFKTRKASQLWIYWNDEPSVVDGAIDRFKFNWTISYYSQSDVSKCAYGCLKEKPAHDIVDLRHEFQLRSNTAVWFVSNCKSNYRLRFAVKLAERFKIKVSGKCNAHFKYSHLPSWLKSLYSLFNQLLHRDKCSRDSNCEMESFLNNKFYLAFESTNCSDYITEKFWRSLSFGLIPVVLQPSRQSYERVAPPNSFIHAQDFNYDATKLAQYLEKVSSNFTLYSKHLTWRGKYSVMHKLSDLEDERICDLCTKLNERQAETNYYDSVSSWFNQKCTRN